MSSKPSSKEFFHYDLRNISFLDSWWRSAFNEVNGWTPNIVKLATIGSLPNLPFYQTKVSNNFKAFITQTFWVLLRFFSFRIQLCFSNKSSKIFCWKLEWNQRPPVVIGICLRKKRVGMVRSTEETVFPTSKESFSSMSS